MNYEQLIRDRRSVRSFDGRPILAEDMQKITEFIRDVPNPYGIPVEFLLLDANEHGLTSPVITGATLWIAGKVKKVPHAEEAFGYSFEEMVLFMQSLGIGTTIIAGTMDRAAFEKAANLAEDEMLACVSPLGYPASSMSVREKMMRMGIKADSRIKFSELFFDGDFGTPLTEEKAGACAKALEMVRLAPSAVNKQPWRAVVTDGRVDFFEHHDKGFVGEASGDLQKIDVGIAISHFVHGAEESGLAGHIEEADISYQVPNEIEYITSWQKN
ncbi:Nitroreductase [Lachnospiraceae bacterium NK3A20]|nr:Nitroreductase [Lachnospiraceae bacterium NK3A20]